MQFGAHALVLMLTGLVAGCSDDSIATRTPDSMEKGSDLYNYYCRHCHKVRGPGELLENRDPNRLALRQHELMLLMQFGDDERHRNMPTFMDVDERQLEKIARYVVELQARNEAEKEEADSAAKEG